MIDVFYDERVLDHDTGRGLWEYPPDGLLAVPELHPENAERVRNMLALLEHGPLASHLRWRAGRLAAEEELATVHPRRYVTAVRADCEAGGARRSPSTVVSAGSWEPLLAAAGTCLAAAQSVLDGESDVAYALVRPPGHHAQPETSDGYCFFNHAALVAELARSAGHERVAVVDWDVHHGNGNQECFWTRDDVLTVSLHQVSGAWGPTHRQTGGPLELGADAGTGHNVNVELGVGAGDAAYLAAFENVVLPILRQYRPTMIVGCCGQDAAAFDANGRQNVSLTGFRGIGDALRRIAGELTGGRMVLVQEGGYARTYAAYCLHATLEGVLGPDAPRLADPLAYIPDDLGRARELVLRSQSALERHWRFPAWRVHAPGL